MNCIRTAVVILNYQTYELTLSLVTNIHEKGLLAEQDIILVIDNNSPNNSSEVLKAEALNLKYEFIHCNQNLGYSSGNNVGLKYAHDNGYDYAIIMNNDIEFYSDPKLFIKSMLDVFDEHKASIVSPLVFNKDKKNIPHFTRRPSLLNLTIMYPLFRIIDYIYRNNQGTRKLYKPSGCCMMVNLLDMGKIDYMDEKLFLYSEEDVLAEKLIKANLLNYSCGDVKVIHNHSKTVKSSFNNKKIIQMKLSSFEYYLSEYLKYRGLKLKFVLFVKKVILVLRG